MSPLEMPSFLLEKIRFLTTYLSVSFIAGLICG